MIRNRLLMTSRQRSPLLLLQGKQGAWYNPSDLTIDKINFVTNHAAYQGGTIDTSVVSTLSSSHCTFDGEKVIVDDGVVVDVPSSNIIYVRTGQMHGFPTTFVMVLKAGEHSEILVAYAGNQRICNLNLSTGTISTTLRAQNGLSEYVNVGIFSETLTSIGGGYYKYVCSYISNYGGGMERIGISVNATGDGVSGFYISTVQVNAGITALPYQRMSSQIFLSQFPKHSLFITSSVDSDPVTRIGEPVGKIKDLSGNNNTLVQPTTTKRPILQGGRVNLLSTSNLSNVLIPAGSTGPSGAFQPLIDSAVYGPNGAGDYSAYDFLNQGSTGSSTIYLAGVATSTTLTFSVYVKAYNGYGNSATRIARPTAVFRMFNASSSTAFDAGTVTLSTGAITGTGWTSTSVGNGWYRLKYTRSTNITIGQTINCHLGGYTTSVTANHCWLMAKPQLEAGSTATEYQEVMNDGTVLIDRGGKKYLKFDGVDDFLSSSSAMNFSASNEISVIAGFRKHSDTVAKPIMELGPNSTGNAGSFGIMAPPTSNGASVAFNSRGSTAVSTSTVTGVASPITLVVAATAKISTDTNNIKVNNGTTVSTSTDQGTTSTYNSGLTFYVGMRNGTSIPFNGHLYGLILVGTLLSEDQLSTYSNMMNDYTGAY